MENENLINESLHLVIDANIDFNEHQPIAVTSTEKKELLKESVKNDVSHVNLIPENNITDISQDFSNELQKAYRLNFIIKHKHRLSKLQFRNHLLFHNYLTRSLSLIFIPDFKGEFKKKSHFNFAEVHSNKFTSNIKPQELINQSTPDTIISYSSENVLTRRNSYESYFNGNIIDKPLIIHDNMSGVEQNIQPLIHSFPCQQMQDTDLPGQRQNYHSDVSKSNSHLILVPAEDKNGRHKEFLQRVYSYPRNSITVTTEKNLNDNGVGVTEKQNKSLLKPTEGLNFCIKKKGSIYSSHTSLASSNGSTSSKISSRKKSNFKKSSTQSNEFEENVERLSDTSSNVSNLSDLSGYEEEYIAIKRFVSDMPDTHSYIKSIENTGTTGTSSNNKLLSDLELKLKEKEDLIKSLQISKDNLNIQVNRLHVKLENAEKEKELCQQQIEINQTRLIECGQREYFEVLKEKATLDGKYKALKLEDQFICEERNLLRDRCLELENHKLDIDKELKLLKNTNTELKNSIKTLEHTNNEREKLIKQFELDLQLKKSHINTLEIQIKKDSNKLSQNETLIENLKSETKTLKASNENLNTKNLELLKMEDSVRKDKMNLEKTLSEINFQFKLLNEKQESYEVKLENEIKTKLNLQKELIEAKANISIISSDRDRCKTEIERLSNEIEENRARAVREKSSLLIHLEELEAEMKERENALLQYKEVGSSQGDQNPQQVSINEERLRKLEADHSKLQKLRIEMKDMVRENESLMEELKHRMNLQRKNEDSIKDMKKDLVVTQEYIGEREVVITSLTEQLRDAKNKLEELFKDNKKKDDSILELREKNMEFEAIKTESITEKKQVDETVFKLKEDLSKLSSSYYRMKHDIAAKDRELETLKKDHSNLVNYQEELNKMQLVNDSLTEKHNIELENLTRELEKANSDQIIAHEEIDQLRKSYNSLKIENENVRSSLSVTNKELNNLQNGLESYKEKVTKKDEENKIIKSNLGELNEKYIKLLKEVEIDREKQNKIMQNNEELQLEKDNMIKFISELKESLKLERVGNHAYEKKCNKIQEELTTSKAYYEKEIEKLNENVKQFENELENMKLSKENELENMKLSKENDLLKYNETLFLKLDEINSLKDDNEKLSQKLAEKILDNETQYNEIIMEKNNSILELERLISTKNNEMENCEKSDPELDATSVKNKISLLKQEPKLSPKKNPELENLQKQYYDLLDKYKNRESDFVALKSKLEKVNLERDTLKGESMKLNENIKEINNTMRVLQEKLNVNERNVITKENELQNWKIKYQSLVDLIPQRDTNSLHQNFSSQSTQCSDEANDSEILFTDVNNTPVMPRCSKSNMCDISYNNIKTSDAISELSSHDHLNKPVVGLFSEVPSSSFKELEESLLDLQKQLNLTLDSLKEKDVEIDGLKRQLMSVLQDCHGNYNCSSPLESLDIEQTFVNTEQTKCDNNDTLCTGNNILLTTNEKEIIDKLKVELDEKDKIINEITTKLEVKDNEMKEKQRIYESNVQVLTRKLKEHMKGRKTSERDLQLTREEINKKIEENKNQYSALMERYLEVEKKNELLECETNKCRQSLNVTSSSLENTKKELELKRKEFLELQHESGVIEELQRCLNSSRTQLTLAEQKLEDEMHLSSETTKKLEHFTHESAKQDKCNKELSLEIENFKVELNDLKNEMSQKNAILEVEKNSSKEKDAKILLLKGRIDKDGRYLKEFKSTLTSFKSRLEELTKRHKEHQALILDFKNIIHLNNIEIGSLIKKNFENDRDMKIKDSSINTTKKELNCLSQQLLEAKTNYSERIKLLNSRLKSAKELEINLNQELKSVTEQKFFYQKQINELRISLNSALSQLTSLKGDSSTLRSISVPSPSFLDTNSVKKLLEKCSGTPVTPNRGLNSLSERLDSLRQEVSTLQNEIQSRNQQYES